MPWDTVWAEVWVWSGSIGSMWWFLEDISLGDSLFPADSRPRTSPFLAMVTVKLAEALCDNAPGPG